MTIIYIKHMVQILVFIADPQHPSPAAQAALQRARAAAGRFADQVEVLPLALTDAAALDRGIALEPTILVDELAVAVGQAPPAGHLVRAIETALQRKNRNV